MGQEVSHNVPTQVKLIMVIHIEILAELSIQTKQRNKSKRSDAPFVAGPIAGASAA